MASFLCLDPAQLTNEQLNASSRLLENFADIPLKPLNEIDGDENRKRLDEAFLLGILGLPDKLLEQGGALDLLRAKLAAEPSIHGSKKGKSAGP